MRLLARSPQAKHVFHQYVIRAQRRDELRKFLADRKIGSEIYYPLPLHLQPVFSYLGLKAGDLPVAEQAAREVLALPMFPELTGAGNQVGGREDCRILQLIGTPRAQSRRIGSKDSQRAQRSLFRTAG